MGRLFEDGRVAHAAVALEKTLGVANERPPLFQA
jgi:hypothetical protein